MKWIALSHHKSELLSRSTGRKSTGIWKYSIHTGDINALFCMKPSKLCYAILYTWAQYSYAKPATLKYILFNLYGSACTYINPHTTVKWKHSNRHECFIYMIVHCCLCICLWKHVHMCNYMHVYKYTDV